MRCWVRAWLISRWWLPDRSPLGWLDCQWNVIQNVYLLKLLMLLCWNFIYSTNYFKFLAHETVCISVPRLRWSQQSAMHSTRNFFPCGLIVDEKNSIHSLNKAVKETEREGWWWCAHLAPLKSMVGAVGATTKRWQQGIMSPSTEIILWASETFVFHCSKMDVRSNQATLCAWWQFPLGIKLSHLQRRFPCTYLKGEPLKVIRLDVPNFFCVCREIFYET